jgi:hypothetical protein
MKITIDKLLEPVDKALLAPLNTRRGLEYMLKISEPGESVIDFLDSYHCPDYYKPDF